MTRLLRIVFTTRRTALQQLCLRHCLSCLHAACDTGACSYTFPTQAARGAAMIVMASRGNASDAAQR